MNDEEKNLEMPFAYYRFIIGIICLIIATYIGTITYDTKTTLETTIIIALNVVFPGSIGYAIGYFIGRAIDTPICQAYLDKKSEIERKAYEAEHTPEKELERKEKELQEEIYRSTPFTNLDEVGDYYIAGISWDLSKNERITGINIILQSNTLDMKNLYFKYKTAYEVEVPYGNTTENYIQIVRQQIYNLRDGGKNKEAADLFRKTFGIDPFTGQPVEKEMIN